MVYQPVIPLSGLSGWKFLQSTYNRQLEAFADSAQIKNDRQYMQEKLSQPIALDDFLNDRRLLSTVMTAFDLGEEVWKRGFIEKALTEVSDPESTFLRRLNNPQYTRFAQALAPQDGVISVSALDVFSFGVRFEAAAFRNEVGEIDNNMRLGLNYQSEITDIVGFGSSQDAIAFRALASVPVRTVLESALNLPSDVRSLPLEKQAELFTDRLERTFGISDLNELSEPENISNIIERFHLRESLNQGISASSPQSVALTLLTGVGSGASQNLFLSRLI